MRSESGHHYNHLPISKQESAANEMVQNLKGKRVAILGLAFKPGTDDMREASSVRIIKYLQEQGVTEIIGYDPHANQAAQQLLGDTIEYAKSIEECLTGSDVCILVTEWDEFKDLQPEDFIKYMRTPVLVDGRRIYKPELFVKKLRFRAIGLGSLTNIEDE